MSQGNLDVLLCEKVWGSGYAKNPEYQKYLRAIDHDGRSASAINNDLRDRIAFKESKRELPPLPKPYEQSW